MRFPCISTQSVYFLLLYIRGTYAASSNDLKLSPVRETSSGPIDPIVTSGPEPNVNLKARDTHFSISRMYGDERLDMLWMLRNTVEVLAELAQRNYHSRMSNFRSNGPFEDIVITVDPVEPAIDVANRIAIMCIWWAMYFVTVERRFRNMEVDCKWDNVVVAQVHFQALKPLSSAQDQTADDSRFEGASTNTTKSVASLSIPMSMGEGNTTTPWLNEKLDIKFNFFEDAQTLTVFDVYIAVMGALNYVARRPSTDAVARFNCGPYTDFDIRITFDSARTIRARPPYYEYRHVIEALRLLPAWIVAQGRFAEVYFNIGIDHIYVALAFLTRSYRAPDLDTPSLAGSPAASHDLAIS